LTDVKSQKGDIGKILNMLPCNGQRSLLTYCSALTFTPSWFFYKI